MRRRGRGRPLGGLAAAVGLALATRLAFVFTTPHLALVNDPADYQRIAVSLATGHGFGPSLAAGGGPSAFRPPLYPAWLALLYTVVGVHVEAARIAQALLGTLAVALLGVLVLQVLHDRRVAVIACVLAAVYVPLIMDGGALLSESIAVPLELAAVCAALAARRSTRTTWWLVAAGVLAGLGVLNRPNMALLLVPLALLARAAVPRRAGLAAVGVVVLVAAVTTVPWLVRDERAFHRFVPLTTQAGLVMAGTYNPVSAHDRRYPAAFRPANLVPTVEASLHAHPVHGELALEHRLRSLSVDYIRHHPAYPLVVAGWNTLRLFELTGLGWARLAARAIGFGSRWADLGVLAYAVVAGLAIAGALVGHPRRVPPAVWLVPVAVVVSTVWFQGETRMRAEVDPFLVLLAALAVDRALPRVRRRAVVEAR